MEQNIKKKISPVELIDLIESKMKQKGWKAADLARHSGVATGILSRLFDKEEKKIGISAINIFEVLQALGIIKLEVESPAWPPEVQKACEIVYKIMTSDNDIAKEALRTNLRIFEDHEEKRKEEIEKKAEINDLTNRMERMEARIQNGMAVVYDLSEKNRRLKNENVETKKERDELKRQKEQAEAERDAVKKSTPDEPLETSEDVIGKNGTT